MYSATIYQLDSTPILKPITYKVELADQGKIIWQQNNCSTCHQIYGLGGYLGPDLTNIYSHPAGINYLKGIIRGGSKQMPEFKFTDSEMDALLEFLHSVDQSGTADPRNFTLHPNGNISPKVP
jgi:nitric oxide reductase subunit C